MKKIDITKEEFLKNVVFFGKNSLRSVIDGETYYVSRKVFNAWNCDDAVFCIEKEDLNHTKWIAVPLTI